MSVIITNTNVSVSTGDMPIVGLAAAQGGTVSLTGGASSTASNAGGAATVAGGLPGATGAGGAVNITGAVGGTTSGVGGAVVLAGGAASANNDNGGNLTLAGGALHGTGASGLVRLQAKTVRTQAAPGTFTAAATLTAAQTLGGILTATHTVTGATIAMTVLDGTALKAALGTVAAGDSIDLRIINIAAAAADTYTLTANADVTIVGSPIVYGTHASVFGSGGATFRFRWTAGVTFIAYRIA